MAAGASRPVPGSNPARGVGIEVWGLGMISLGVWGFGVQGAGLRVYGLGLRVEGVGCGV